MSEDAGRKGARRGSWKLAGVVLFMFGFGFALVPLYGAICQLTGLNGKNAGMLVSADVKEQVDPNRTVKVQFLTTVNGGRVWSFSAEQPAVEVHPGQLVTVYFDARNQQDQEVVGQAVPSVAPWNAARHLHKTECFCFNQQPFKANEAKRMPVRFMLDPALPADVDTVTLSYTFFDVTELAQHSRAGDKPNS
ncbi:MAG TPA: cytochrome c oxidase assembly protein [Nevskia sp.]|nr:cytochrome c oxidase assembly protein [Nevskia sp.]